VIRINLLPLELRRGNRMPARVIAAAFGAAVATSASIGWFGIVYFGDLGKAEVSLQSVEKTLAEKEKRVEYHTLLEQNRKDYAERVQTIQAIGKSRRLWAKFCDELIDVVNQTDLERHLAWFSSISVKGDPKKGATVTMPASVQGDESSRVANFHEDLEGAPFASDLASKSDPTWRLTVEKDRTPAAALEFPLTLQFKPTVPPDAPKKGAPKNPPAATPAK
jgi:flagellar biosynthesis regulator FlaF